MLAVSPPAPRILIPILVAATLCAAPPLARAMAPSPKGPCDLPPHAGYHGGTSALPPRPFFEGWYLRVTPRPETCPPWEGGPLAFVHHVFDPHLPLSPRRGAGVQALTPAGTAVREGRDLSRFEASAHALDVRNAFSDGGGGDFFELTESRARGRVTGDGGRRLLVEYDFRIEARVGWGGGPGDRQHATAGWLSALPLFEPHYQVLISRGEAWGHVTVRMAGGGGGGSAQVEERRYHLDGAAVYLEKNWGGSFPSRWWWVQANAFPGEPSLSVTSTGAVRGLPLVGQEEEVALVGVHWEGRFFPFPDVAWSVGWGQWVIRGIYGDYVVTLLGSCGKDDRTQPVSVRCPTPLGMREAALETYQGELRVLLQRRAVVGGMLETVVDATTHAACLEIGGVPWEEKEWMGRSAMAEPLKSVVMNVELERAGADMLQFLKNFIEIPGL